MCIYFYIKYTNVAYLEEKRCKKNDKSYEDIVKIWLCPGKVMVDNTRLLKTVIKFS